MAALCRAAGIPARVVWGSIYTPEKGGSFGHHAWNEVYMGGAGWIPVDVTLNEPDYANAGHLRLGVLHTWQTVINFREMEILEVRTRE
jgi:transglutaminase-like putative cysteine protease